MRLNMDCIRDILFCIEDNCDLRHYCRFFDTEDESYRFLGTEPPEITDYQNTLQEKYDNGTLIYHVRYCTEAGLIKRQEGTAENLFIIWDLTVDGHELLGNIRDDKSWKNRLSKLDSQSLGTVSEIAKSLAIFLGKRALDII